MVSTSFPRWDGDFSGLMVWNLIRWLRANGCKVKVVTQHYAGCAERETIDGVEIHRFRYMWPARLQRIGTVSGVIDDLRNSWIAKLSLPFFLLGFMWKVCRVSRKCDVLHVQWAPTILAVLPTVWIRGLPVIVNSRTNPDTALWRMVYRLIIPVADFVVYNSSTTQKSTEKVARSVRSTFIGSGINIPQFQRPADFPPRNYERAKLAIVVVARLVEYKGIEYLLRALKSIEDRVQFQLDLFSDGPLRPHLEQLSRDLGIDGHVTFHGETPREQILPSMWSADLFVLPSVIDSYGRTEGFGAVLLEAMATGLPVIASRVGGIVDIVNGENGILTEPRDSESLARALLEMAENPGRRKQIADTGHQWLLSNFSDEAMCRRYKIVYDQVLIPGKGAEQQ